MESGEDLVNLSEVKTINVLGDSISHGANAIDIPNDSWTGILRQHLQEAFGTKNHGYESMHDVQTNVLGQYYGAHSIVRTGFTDSEADDKYGMHKTSSNVPGDQLTITTKIAAKKARIWHTGKESQVEIRKNGEVLTTLQLKAANIGLSESFPLQAIPGTTFEIIKKDHALTEITGIEYLDDEGAFVFDNISRTGAKLGLISNEVLDKVAETDLLLLALGHNDKAHTSIERFQERLTYLHEKAKENETFVVVCNFIWSDEPNEFEHSTALKAFAESCPNRIYIGFNEFWPGADKLLAEGILSDVSHPSVLGHRMIAEKVAEVIGLKIPSEK